MTDQTKETQQLAGAALVEALPSKLRVEAVRVLKEAEDAAIGSVGEERVGSQLARLPAPEVNGFATHLHSYVREYIAAADQKAGFVFAICSGLLVYLYQDGLQNRWMKGLALWSTGDLFAFTAMLFLFAAVVAAAFVVLPRLSTTHRGLVFFMSVAEFESASEYAGSISRETGETLTTALLRHGYDLARICARKYRVLNLAIWMAVLGVVVSVLVLLLTAKAA